MAEILPIRPEERRALQAVVAVARNSGWGYGLGLAVTVAQMLAVAASSVPAMADASEALLDPGTELTRQTWFSILDRFLAVDTRLQSAGIDSRIQDEPPPGLLDRIRRLLLELEAVRSGKPVPVSFLQAVLDLVDWRYGEFPSLSREAQFLIADGLAVRAGERVHCAEVGAAGIALLLAAEWRARVLLEVGSTEAAKLCVWLAAAAGAEMDVWVRPPQQHPILSALGDEDFQPVFEGFDAAVLYPSFGWHEPRALLESRLNKAGLPPGSSLDSLHVMETARRARRSACLVPAGYLSRTTKTEQLLKEAAILQHGLDAVVALPRGSLRGLSSISVSVLLFRSSRHLRHDDGVLMVNPRAVAELGSTWHQEAIEVLRRREGSWMSALVSLHDIATQDFNLTVERYVLDLQARQARDALAAAQAQLEDVAELHRPQSLPVSRAGRGEQAEQDALLPMAFAERLLEVSVSDIDDAGIVRQPRKEAPLTPEVVQRSRKARLEAGDVLIVNKGSVGKVGFIRWVPDGEAWLASQSFVVARLRRGGAVSDPHVLFRFLSSKVGQAALRSLIVGTDISVLQMADVRRLPVLVPPKNAQAEVVEEVRRFFDTQDRITALRDEAAARLRTMWPDGPAAWHAKNC